MAVVTMENTPLKIIFCAVFRVQAGTRYISVAVEFDTDTFYYIIIIHSYNIIESSLQYTYRQPINAIGMTYNIMCRTLWSRFGRKRRCSKLFYYFTKPCRTVKVNHVAMIDSKESAWIYSESVGVSTAVLPWTDESYVARVDQRTRILYVYINWLLQKLPVYYENGRLLVLYTHDALPYSHTRSLT